TTVLMPTMTASYLALSRCPNARDSLLVIHLDSPVLVAILPSSDSANLRVKKLVARVMNLFHGSMSASASSLRTPSETSMPDARNRSIPEPGTWGLGSRHPITTRATLALIKALTQGGVRPSWLQGSRVT